MTIGKHRVAILEDDADFRGFLRHLLKDDYDLVMVRNGAELQRSVDASEVDVVLLDIGLPGEDGLSIALQIRSISGVPLIFLSGHSSEEMIVMGLTLGADDYITKPCQSRVLKARIENALARAKKQQAVSRRHIQFDGVVFEIGKQHLTNAEGHRVKLTAKESQILSMLARATNLTQSRDAICKHIYGRDWDSESRVLEVHICNLRGKLAQIGCESKAIVPVRGIGYRLDLTS
ncbi:MAG: response regulator transcription factor [Polynucleobacter sp.]|nr:response regulator transcription factor [Polynucleobacter sp.]